MCEWCGGYLRVVEECEDEAGELAIGSFEVIESLGRFLKGCT